MKKLLIISLAVILIMTAVIPVWAAADDASVSSSVSNEPAARVDIAFKVGDDTLKINGKDTKVEKPFVLNGVTLVPIRVITEAFGAEITWNASERSIVINYADVQIKLVIDSKDAAINGKSVTLSGAPAIVNGTTMVPLRFITENFGADVSYDNATSEVTVTKEIASSTSIKDFSLILKKTTRQKVGDSYYKWSMSLPKNLKISTRNFSGTDNAFTAIDGTYSMSVVIKKQGDETLDSIMASMLDDIKKYTIVSYAKEKENGQDYVKFVYRDSTSTYEERQYLKGGMIFILDLGAKDFDTYKNSTEIPALLNSFTTDFLKDGNTEDLSDVTKDGYRTYEDKKLDWSVNVLPDWSENKDENKENEIEFDSDAGDNFNVKMYSIEDGLTLDKWVDDDQKQISDDYNTDRVKVLKVEDVQINNVKCKKMYSSIKLSDSTLYTCDLYAMGKNYRYDISWIANQDTYNDSAKNAQIESMINSFKFTEPESDDVGTLIDPDKISNTDAVRKLENKENKWYMEFPAEWTAQGNNNDEDDVFYGSSDGNIAVEMFVLKDMNVDAYTEQFKSSMQAKFPENTISDEQTINDKGTSVKKFVMTLTSDKSPVKTTYYVLNKNGHTYAVTFIIADIRRNQKNEQMLDNIWQSMKFE